MPSPSVGRYVGVDDDHGAAAVQLREGRVEELVVEAVPAGGVEEDDAVGAESVGTGLACV
ncbi:hypothetical protein ACXZ65_17250 [Streptomyces aculeolatus]